MRSLLFLLFSFGFIAVNISPACAGSAPTLFSLGIGLEFSSGAFGTGSTSTYATVPVIFDWFPTDRIDLEITVPLLYQRTSNTGHAALGTTMQSTTTSVAKSVNRGSMGGGGGGSMFGGDYGLGDITVTGGYTLLSDSDSSPNLRPTLYIKFPTADVSKGFGTGEIDFGAGIAVSKWLGNWQPFAEGRYVVQGASHDETGAENFVTADTGISYSWSDTVITSGFVRYGSKLFDSMAPPLETRAKLVWRFSERAYTDIYALKGLSDGSPDYGGGASVFYEF